MYRDTTRTYAICDGCGIERPIGENLDWNNRLNGALSNGFTMKEQDNQFKLFCRKCADKEGGNDV